MKQLTFDEAILALIKNERVLKIANDESGLSPKELESLLREGGDFPDELYDALIELMEEGEIVDSAEIEFMTSYSTTSDFWLYEFGGIYFIKNMEAGDLGYFTSI